MKIGYPCLNYSVDCKANKTFRLSSYSTELAEKTIENNIDCLKRILQYNKEKGFLFFRISSEIIPFGSHSILDFDWKTHFLKTLKELGTYIKLNNMRISMHPDQFVILNSPKEEVVTNSIKELEWHADLLDLMELDETAKIQIHIGGAYGEKEVSIQRFVEKYKILPLKIKKRLVIENDDRIYSLKDCILINKQTGIPIIFDSFHHQCLNNGEAVSEAIVMASNTWKEKDGIMMTDYSSQDPKGKVGKHIDSIDESNFEQYLIDTRNVDFDIILEIKDKETSAKRALEIAKKVRTL